jgi:hypothetical protein
MLDEAREIFLDPDTPLHQRIKAASLVLQHDAPSDIVADAAEFLTAVSKSENVAKGYRLDAIEVLAKREVPRAASPGSAGGGHDFRRLRWQQIAIFERQLALMKAGEWPPEHKDWMSDLCSDDWIAPEGDPPGWETEEAHGWYEHVASDRKLTHANAAALTDEQRRMIKDRQRKAEEAKRKAEAKRDES